MIRYTSLSRSTNITLEELHQGYFPWVFLHHNKIMNKIGWGTLTIL